jgi:hypothetical protein
MRETNQRVIQAGQSTERAVEEEARRLGHSHYDGGDPVYSQPQPAYNAQPNYAPLGYNDPNYNNSGYNQPQAQQPPYPYQR